LIKLSWFSVGVFHPKKPHPTPTKRRKINKKGELKDEQKAG